MVKVIMFHSTPDRLAELRAKFPSVNFVAPENRADGAKDIASADVIFGGCTNEEFEAAEKLRWIQAASAGVEFMWKIPAIADSNVVVTNARGAHAATIAEHHFALLLGLTRQVIAHHDHQKKHEWVRAGMAGGLVGIKDLTLGLIGFGNIGRAIARRATGFEMKVIAVDAQPVPASEGVAEVWPLSRLNDMCKVVDVLTISAPITPQTRGMVGPEQIALLKKGSYVIAVSRGGIVNEPALIQGLKSGQIAGAGLDVQETEPLPADSPLWDAPNILITPHDSGASNLTTNLMWSIFIENLGHFVRKEPLTNMVDKKLGY
ncbi:MAG: D-2-hydroxyacid dehydrogenase [Chloroflexota bacterium]|nr:MAG: D-2-hydroxyacid dehydrogenase [Chloroflexota bacterium]